MSSINDGNMQHSIVRAFDDASQSLKTTIVNAAVDVTVSAFTDSIAIADVSGNKVSTTLVSTKRGLDVNVVDITLDSTNDSVSVPGVSTAVNQATQIVSLSNIDTKQDYSNFQSQHVTLSANTDTTITFSSSVRMVRVTNWDTVNRILVKNGSISSNTDSTASRVGVAPVANVSNNEIFPIVTNTIHVRSAAASECTVEGFS